MTCPNLMKTWPSTSCRRATLLPNTSVKGGDRPFIPIEMVSIRRTALLCTLNGREKKRLLTFPPTLIGGIYRLEDPPGGEVGGALQAGIVDSYPPLLWKRRLTWPAPDVYFVQSPAKGEFNHSTGRRKSRVVSACTRCRILFFGWVRGEVWRGEKNRMKGVFVIGNSLQTCDGNGNDKSLEMPRFLLSQYGHNGPKCRSIWFGYHLRGCYVTHKNLSIDYFNLPLTSREFDIRASTPAASVNSKSSGLGAYYRKNYIQILNT